jgi:hypothetical protein
MIGGGGLGACSVGGKDVLVIDSLNVDILLIARGGFVRNICDPGEEWSCHRRVVPPERKRAYCDATWRCRTGSELYVVSHT